MKKIVLLFAAVAAVSLTSCNESASAKIDEANLTAAANRESVEANYPVMSFDESEYDFGTVNEGTVVEKEYKFKNTGTSPLIIVNAKGSCGCTVPTWTKEPVAPGEEGSLLVKFNTSGKPNAQSKSVTITTNTEAGTEVIVIKGFVTGKSSAPNA
ncbi:Protein of unknown function [Nonlabens sp. Hel1_33_55]|uniref:DUF1573 domain-containing protein n=1 Tax=Nonlabens sp. Hel1_33_55 TaxID=1336802 RepID=UPI000875D9CA|nr:DUF1573 domain-containing protein [Nonlabens sp. Hel1_33_55]SCX89101.1 Protein of unknown function [Nonlabens sp. Hel1_33_55]